MKGNDYFSLQTLILQPDINVLRLMHYSSKRISAEVLNNIYRYGKYSAQYHKFCLSDLLGFHHTYSMYLFCQISMLW